MMLYEVQHEFERDWLKEKLKEQGYKTVDFDGYISSEKGGLAIVSSGKIAQMFIVDIDKSKWSHDKVIPVSSLILSDLEYDGGYLFSSKEEFDYLMMNLEGRRYVWENGDNPTDLPLFDEETSELLIYTDDIEKTLLYTNVIPDENGIETIGENLLDEPPVASEDKEEEVEDEEVVLDSYPSGDIDFFDIWYKTYSMDEFRTGMEMLASYFLHDRVGDRSINLSRAQDVIEELDFYEDFERIIERARSEKEE